MKLILVSLDGTHDTSVAATDEPKPTQTGLPRKSLAEQSFLGQISPHTHPHPVQNLWEDFPPPLSSPPSTPRPHKTFRLLYIRYSGHRHSELPLAKYEGPIGHRRWLFHELDSVLSTTDQLSTQPGCKTSALLPILCPPPPPHPETPPSFTGVARNINISHYALQYPGPAFQTAIKKKTDRYRY